MTLDTLFSDKSITSKQKTAQINQWLLEGILPIDELLDFAAKSKHAVKATCIEGIEQSTKINQGISNETMFLFVTMQLLEKEPRVKWESARVIGNCASRFIDLLPLAIKNLILNSHHEGTVVRWSTAYALGEIIKLNTKNNLTLIKTVMEIIEKEEKNSIKKIYSSAIKKVTL
ncbi:MAG TPA: HEAT repeat domain-containing protein [Bacteroidia bacterium]|nr:HEAT repeat domain-containing protein [Bacteroidia bacterium]